MMSGEMIAARYRIEGRLGVGGMSTVQRAFDTRLERPVAVKLLAEHLAEDPQFVSRFQREALAAARLIHPNIVQVFDYGLDEASHRHYIVMELVSGHSGAELLRDQGSLGIEATIDMVGQACRGLDYAHRNGVVHRDVKPGNILRADDGTVKIADFGIAKAAEQSSITQIGSVLGTAAYLSPEQARGEEAGPAADVYSLGVVVYQLISGRVPYEASSLTELAYKQQNEAPVPLDSVAPGVDPALSHAVTRALAIHPEDRYESAVAMGEALRGGVHGVEPPLPEGVTEATQLLGDATGATEWLQDDETEATRRVATPAPEQRRPRQPREARPATPAPAPVPVPAPAPAPAPSPRRKPDRRAEKAPKPKKRGRFRRALLFLFLVAAVSGGIVAVVLSQASDSTRDEIEQIVIDNVDQGIQEFRDFINEHTR